MENIKMNFLNIDFNDQNEVDKLNTLLIDNKVFIDGKDTEKVVNFYWSNIGNGVCFNSINYNKQIASMWSFYLEFIPKISNLIVKI